MGPIEGDKQNYHRKTQRWQTGEIGLHLDRGWTSCPSLFQGTHEAGKAKEGRALVGLLHYPFQQESYHNIRGKKDSSWPREGDVHYKMIETVHCFKKEKKKDFRKIASKNPLKQIILPWLKNKMKHNKNLGSHCKNCQHTHHTHKQSKNSHKTEYKQNKGHNHITI